MARALLVVEDTALVGQTLRRSLPTDGDANRAPYSALPATLAERRME